MNQLATRPSYDETPLVDNAWLSGSNEACAQFSVRGAVTVHKVLCMMEAVHCT